MFWIGAGNERVFTARAAQLFDRLETELARSRECLPWPRRWSLSRAAGLNFNASVDGVDGPVRFLTHFNSVSPDFFRTFGIELLAGREFNDTDSTGATSVAIVNQRFAERLRSRPRRRRAADHEWSATSEIVGVVADAKDREVARRDRAAGVHAARAPWTRELTFYVRSARPPEELAERHSRNGRSRRSDRADQRSSHDGAAVPRELWRQSASSPEPPRRSPCSRPRSPRSVSTACSRTPSRSARARSACASRSARRRGRIRGDGAAAGGARWR